MGADKKKKKPAPKKDKKQAQTKKSSKRHPLVSAIYANLLKICYTIAICDLIHALYFAVQATILLVRSANLYSILAVFGTIFWVLSVILLLAGLWKRRPTFVRTWLIFSLIGFVLDILFLIWGIASSITVDWDHIKEFTILFIGIAIESTCIYLVYRFYMCMDPCRMVDEPEKGKPVKKKKVKLDKKACERMKQQAKKSDQKKPKDKSKKKSPDKKKKGKK
ncbi:uncharacterized protein LOC115623118 [Scaptodrosophila lebanonensis]|uniref:Uncharacterized protein LOC115623118 n=1 Tax=Drosophila lebanonensis TaxID=7225 RepID=A0A6J2TCS1_DROLE|nr:uncharacterized protein LOC115623118 [Scaptodrosophila lebanonensis]